MATFSPGRRSLAGGESATARIDSAGVTSGDIELTDVFAADDGYADYRLALRNLQANGDVILRFSDDGGATYYNGTDYFWSRRRSGSGGGGSNDGPAGKQTEIKPLFNTDADNDARNGVDGQYYIYGATATDQPTRITGTNVMFADAMTTRHWNFSGGGMLETATAVDSVKLSAGTALVGGTVAVYGIE